MGLRLFAEGKAAACCAMTLHFTVNIQKS